ncbi:hypothetical protein GGI07_001961 [Coemansia sp. Benny D115]|nr:hypothetical protein GGI07_001961 [Coemansia sp. Benny D115]
MLFGRGVHAEFDFQDKVVVVTGALSSVGRQLAHRLVALGCLVSLIDSQADGSGEALSAELCEFSKALGTPETCNGLSDMPVVRCVYIRSDLRQPQDIRLMIEATILAFGRMDVLVNNAHTVADDDDASAPCGVNEVVDLIDINLRAPVVATWVFAEYLRQSSDGRRGVVVSVAAVAGLVPGRGREIFGAASAGLIHFTQASSSREKTDGLRVCALAPYYVEAGGGGRLLPGSRHVGGALTLSSAQVVDAVLRCIRDERLSGRTVLVAGGSMYRHSWAVLVVARLHVFLIMLWSMLVLAFRRVLGAGRAVEPVAAVDAPALLAEKKKAQ